MYELSWAFCYGCLAVLGQPLTTCMWQLTLRLTKSSVRCPSHRSALKQQKGTRKRKGPSPFQFTEQPAISAYTVVLLLSPADEATLRLVGEMTVKAVQNCHVDECGLLVKQDTLPTLERMFRLRIGGITEKPACHIKGHGQLA